MILVDSNVIIDVLSQDASWLAWTEAASSDAADGDEIAINPIIYAEIASGFATMAARPAMNSTRLRHWLSAV
jgi:predicted nucleic acid-binding protein